MEILEILCKELNIRRTQAEAAVKLLDDGNTVPFIARYRKEATGGLDDDQLRALTDRLTYLRNLQKRREEVLSLIGEQGKLTEEIEAAVAAAATLTEIDDIYRPFRPKRKTRASVARERGLEPLAALLMAQEESYTPSLEEMAEQYIDEEKGQIDMMIQFVCRTANPLWPAPAILSPRTSPTMRITAVRSVL